MRKEDVRDIAAGATGLDAGMLVFGEMREAGLEYQEYSSHPLVEKCVTYTFGAVFSTLATAGALVFRSTANAVGRCIEAKYNFNRLNETAREKPDWVIYPLMGADLLASLATDALRIGVEIFVAGIVGFIPGWLALIGMHMFLNGLSQTPKVLNGRRRLDMYS